ncbi:hypothetical protein HELRODRAFT_136402, partial [Helobdella robusta]|uniref:G-protein coupled receptors family 1 profile domain-containing protein n=1 Tax=Helobdella robusta TaxID=6412 RepID=T1EID9_HELRO
FLAVVMGLISLFTVGSNIMVFLSFKIEKKLRTLTNYFLLSMAVADCAVGLISIPVFAQYVLQRKWILGPTVCKLWLSEDYTVCQASVAHLFAISLDRYFSITRPLTYRVNRTTKKIIFALLITWLVPFLVTAPWIWLYPFFDKNKYFIIPENECYVPF